MYWLGMMARICNISINSDLSAATVSPQEIAKTHMGSTMRMQTAGAGACPCKHSLGVIWLRQNIWVLAVFALDWKLHLVPLRTLLPPSAYDWSGHLHLCLAANTHEKRVSNIDTNNEACLGQMSLQMFVKQHMFGLLNTLPLPVYLVLYEKPGSWPVDAADRTNYKVVCCYSDSKIVLLMFRNMFTVTRQQSSAV